MRISVEPLDPGYANFHLANKAKVYFEGAELKYALTADEEQRCVLVYKLDAFGHPCINPEDIGELLKEWRYGHVRVEITNA